MRAAFRASIYHCLRDPGNAPDETASEYFEDGLLIVNDGRVEQLGEASRLLPSVTTDTELVDLRGEQSLAPHAVPEARVVCAPAPHRPQPAESIAR